MIFVVFVFFIMGQSTYQQAEIKRFNSTQSCEEYIKTETLNYIGTGQIDSVAALCFSLRQTEI